MRILKLLFILLVIFILITYLNYTAITATTKDDGNIKLTSSKSINYQTIIVPDITNFEMGYKGVATTVQIVPSISSFRIGKYEVTYEQWFIVKQWATNNGYTFSNPGREGHDGKEGAPPTNAKDEPVTMINWRDCIVWCNAASQYEGLTPVYYTDDKFTSVLKISTNNTNVNNTLGSEDNPFVNWSVNGYRLPTEAEWEASARYIDGKLWLRGDAPSGWIDSDSDGNWKIEKGDGIWEEDNPRDNYSEVHAVAWWYSNSNKATHVVGGKNPNNLGIYDMSGNVWEWCWDWYTDYPKSSNAESNHKGPTVGSERVCRGGSWNYPVYLLRTSNRNMNSSGYEFVDLGFRVARKSS